MEDAAVLGNLFSHLTCPEDIPLLLHAYQKLRHERTTETQASSRLNQRIFHLPDGEEQEARDREMIRAMIWARLEADMPLEGLNPDDYATVDNDHCGNPNQWADKVKNAAQFSYDADAEAEKWWREEGEILLTRATEGRA